MKAITQTTIATPSTEVIRSADILVRDGLLSIDGERVGIKKGSDISPSELAGFIVDRAEKAKTFGSQARWAFYSAGLLPNGTEVQEEIAKRLREAMSPSAFHQLTSESRSICPLIVANEFKTPISVLKDAMKEIKVDAKTGKVLPLTKQSPAAKKLIPLLKDGTVSQAKVRAIRAEATKPTAPAAPASQPKAKTDDNSEAVAYGNFLRALQDADKYAQANKLAGDDLQKALVILTNIGRALGVTVSVPNAKPAPATAAPAPEVKK